MITEWFIEMVLGVQRGLLGFLPDVDLPVVDLAGAVGIMQRFNEFLPVDTALMLGGFSITFVTTLTMFRLARMLLSHVPGVGGSG